MKAEQDLKNLLNNKELPPNIFYLLKVKRELLYIWAVSPLYSSAHTAHALRLLARYRINFC